MTSAALLERADRLANYISGLPLDARREIVGGVGLGKTTLLRALETSLPAYDLIPIMVSPPTEAMDTGCAAVLQIGDRLHRANIINGQLDQLKAPDVAWEEKFRLTGECIKTHGANVVLLCDEPDRWPIAADAEASRAAYNNAHAEQMARWVKEQAPCRRINTTSWSEPGDAFEPHFLPKFDLPLKDMPWGPLESIAAELKQRLGAKLSRVTFLEMRLLSALAAVTSVENAVSRQADWPDCWQLAKTLIESLESSTRWHSFLHFLKRLPFVRGTLTPAVMKRLGADVLDSDERNLLAFGLLDPVDPTCPLHPVLRNSIAQRTVLGAPERLQTHKVLADFYAGTLVSGIGQVVSEIEAKFEGFHHSASCGETNPVFHAFFVDQLHILGRTLSKDLRDYPRAAEVFRYAIKLDDKNDYAHHYFAYNLDCAAADRQLSQQEYLRAIELNPKHPWLWSRWINFLITTGRLPEARQEWSRAMNALRAEGGRASDFIYEELHLWVARLLLHRGQLEFAEQVLDGVGKSQRSKHAGFRALDRLLKAMRIAREGRGVFPANIDPDDYWRNPHLEFPETVGTKLFAQWNPARVDAVDEKAVHLVVGQHEASTGKTVYGQIELPVERFNAASLDEAAERMTAGRLLEIAFYGDEGVMRIRIHPDTPYNDPDLPFFDPPNPQRYLQKQLVSQ